MTEPWAACTAALAKFSEAINKIFSRCRRPSRRMASYTSGSVVRNGLAMNALAFLGENRGFGRRPGLRDRDVHRRRHLRMQLDRNRHRSQFLDRMLKVNFAFVHLNPLGGQGIGDVLRRHGSEELVVL